MGITAVERALVILKHIAGSPNGVGVREMARTLSYSPAFVQKSLQTLVTQGFAQQDPVTQQYRLGPVALQVGLAGLAKLELYQVARPHLETLAEHSGETALLAIRQGDRAVYIDKVLPHSEIRLDVQIGGIRPYNCTAVGKVLLAAMPEAEVDALAARGAFLPVTPNATVDLVPLKAELTQIRDQGVAYDREEFTLGAMCLGAPICDHQGAVVAAVALAGPKERVTQAIPMLISAIKACAENISAALGRRTDF